MKIPFWATFFTLLASAILAGLGTWQVQRLYWKQGILNELAVEAVKDPYQHAIDLGSFKAAYWLERGNIKGHFLDTAALYIGPISKESQLGFELYLPFLPAQDERTLMINLGWVPDAFRRENPDFRMDPQERQVIGYMRRSSKKSLGVQRNDSAREIWHWLDLKFLSNYYSIPVYEEGYFVLTEKLDSTARYPIPNEIGMNVPNNHLQYAIFWFSMLFVLWGVYYLRFFSKRNKA